MRPVLLAAVGFAAALAISEEIGAYALIPMGACALFALCAFFAMRGRTEGRKLRRGAAIICCAALVGSAWHYAYTAIFYSPAAELIGSCGEYSAVVRDYSKQYMHGGSVEVELDGVGANARVRMWMGDYTELAPGDRIAFTGSLSAPDTTPGFDFLSFYRSRGIFLDGEIYEMASVRHAQHTPLRFIPAVVRHLLGTQFDELYDGSANAIVRALCIGDRSHMSDSLRLAVRAGGLSHLLAISGLHVTLLCGALMVNIRDRRRGRLGVSFFAMLAVLLFVLACGAPASAVRAFVMHIMMLIAVLIRRDADPLSALGTALLLLLIINPYSINDAGLQLSFLATLGLLLHFGDARRWVCEHMTDRFADRLPRPLRSLLSTTCDAVVITLISNMYTAPLIAYLFGSLPIYGVLSNLPSLLLVPFALLGGLVSAVVGFFSPAAAHVIAAAVHPALSGLCRISYFFARIPMSPIDMSSPYNICAFALTYSFIIMWRIMPDTFRGRLCAPMICAAFMVSLGFGELERRTDAMRVSALDVGQGQSILLLSGTDAALIDCGGNCYEGAGCKAAEALMLSGRRQLNALILTHCHTDHINGVADLLDFIDIRNVYAPESEEDIPALDMLRAYGAEIHYVTNSDMALPLSSAAVKIYRPVQKMSENESGTYILASAGKFDLLVTGDLGSTSETIILARGTTPPVELLVAGHHGSKNSTSDAFLDALTPQTAIISVGDNSYGHPSFETLSRLGQHDISVYRTDLGGSITVRIGKEVR